MSDLKQTPLFDYHIECGAKMVPFSGWNMPVQYPEGIIAEHLHTRNSVSIFDICHMGEFQLAGPDAAQIMDKIFARQVSNQKIGSCRYNLLLNSDGKIMDDLIIYRMEQDDFFIVVNAGTIDGDFKQIQSQLPSGISFNNLSEHIGKIDLQGPKSVEVLEKCGIDRSKLPNYFNWTTVDFCGTKCILSRTGYTGELGFELYFNIEFTEDIWIKLYNTAPVKPAGLGARDTLRLEVGYSLYGHELSTEFTPLEAGLGELLKMDDSRDFTGKDALRQFKVGKKLYGIKLDGRRAGRAGSPVYDAKGEKIIGKVTSGAFAPSITCSIAMAYLDIDAEVDVDAVVMIEAGSTKIPGRICPPPFYKKGTVREKI